MARAKRKSAAKKQRAAATKSRKKSPKKSLKKSSKKAHRPSRQLLLPSVPVVGVVTSIGCTGNALGQAFCASLRQSGWEYDPTQPPGQRGRVILDPREAKGSYGSTHKDLADAVKDLNGNPNVAVIVAAGGLPAAEAVSKFSTKKPYVVLIGTQPQTFVLDPNKLLRGGVNLKNVELNAGRSTNLCNHYPVRQNRVCLIHNKNNSELSKLELQFWRQQGWPDEPGVQGDNDPAYFPQALAKAKAKADAVVISSDPFFTQNLGPLVKAANNSNVYVCYPFSLYATPNPPNPQPATGRSMWYGPDLQDAYRSLGSTTGNLLVNTAVATNLQTPQPKGPTYL